MWKKLFFALVAAVLMPGLGNGQDPKAVLDGVAKSMGDMKSLQYAASGANYAFADTSVRFLKFGRSLRPVNLWAVTPGQRPF